MANSNCFMHKDDSGVKYWKNLELRVVITVVLFLVLFISSAGQTKEIEQDQGIVSEIKFGLLSHDVDNLWSGFKREKGVDVNCAAVFSLSKHLFGGDIHPVLGASVNTSGYTSKIYLDGVWRYALTEYIFGAFGLGVAVHNGERHLVSHEMKALGSQILFHFPMEIGYQLDRQFSFSVYFDHMSNAYLNSENEGLDTLGFRIGYIF